MIYQSSDMSRKCVSPNNFSEKADNKIFRKTYLEQDASEEHRNVFGLSLAMWNYIQVTVSSDLMKKMISWTSQEYLKYTRVRS